jgi:hypothetical protein
MIYVFDNLSRHTDAPRVTPIFSFLLNCQIIIGILRSLSYPNARNLFFGSFLLYKFRKFEHLYGSKRFSVSTIIIFIKMFLCSMKCLLCMYQSSHSFFAKPIAADTSCVPIRAETTTMEGWNSPINYIKNIWWIAILNVMVALFNAWLSPLSSSGLHSGVNYHWSWSAIYNNVHSEFNHGGCTRWTVRTFMF